MIWAAYRVWETERVSYVFVTCLSKHLETYVSICQRFIILILQLCELTPNIDYTSFHNSGHSTVVIHST